ncbi:MAG: hypothetical protein ACLR2E_21015 [Lachnospiraceae bacterium]
MKGKAQYPFGYGLTYGKLELTAAKIQENGTGADVRVTVYNSGGQEVTETIQVYVKNSKSPYAPLHPALAAFQPDHRSAWRDLLEKTLTLDESAFTIVDEKGQRQTAAGTFEVYAGFSQPDERSVELMGCAPVRLEFQVSRSRFSWLFHLLFFFVNSQT